jgi:hypothetical protein
MELSEKARLMIFAEFLYIHPGNKKAGNELAYQKPKDEYSAVLPVCWLESVCYGFGLDGVLSNHAAN